MYIAEMLKIATWNVNSLRVRLPHVLGFIGTHNPDILCLQETKVEDALFPHEAFKHLGLHIAHHGQKSYNGVAILSRHPLEDVSLGFAGHNLEDQTRVISATTAGVRAISAYVPNGESLTSPKFQFKRNFYEHLTKHIAEELKSHPNLVLVGDFNIAADERDVANPTRAAKDVLFTPEERAWLTHLQQSNNLHDAFRLVSEEANVYSWWDYRTFARSQQNGMRIDYLFVSEALKAKVKAVHHHADQRTQTQPSDHVAVLAEIDV